MKKYFLFEQKFNVKTLAIQFFVFAFLFVSCDKVEAPYEEQQNTSSANTNTNTNGGGGSGNNNNTNTCNDNFNAATATRKMVLFDFTGHKCGNCPEAHDASTALHNQYGDKLIVLGVHVSGLAIPSPSTATRFTYDFRCTTGNLFDQTYSFDAVGVPTAWINYFDTTNLITFSNTAWSTPVANEINIAPDAYITLQNTFSTSTNILNTTVTSHYLNNLTAGKYNLCVYLLEDSISNWQKDYRLPSGQQDIATYKHRHVLRANLSDHYGDVVNPDGAMLKKDSCSTKSYSLDFTGKDWNPAHCSVVAFLYSKSTKKVIQAEEKKIK